MQTEITETSSMSNGFAAAATLSACCGVFTLGLLTTLASASGAVKAMLNWWSPAGPLTGKSGAAVIIWLLSWAILHALLSQRDVRFGRVATWATVLLILGFFLMFPPVFEAVAPGH